MTAPRPRGIASLLLIWYSPPVGDAAASGASVATEKRRVSRLAYEGRDGRRLVAIRPPGAEPVAQFPIGVIGGLLLDFMYDD